MSKIEKIISDVIFESLSERANELTDKIYNKIESKWPNTQHE